MNKVALAYNNRCVFAAERRSLGASFASIADTLEVSKDRARTMVGRGNRLCSFAKGDMVVRGSLTQSKPVLRVLRVYSNRILVEDSEQGGIRYTICKWYLRKAA